MTIDLFTFKSNTNIYSDIPGRIYIALNLFSLSHFEDLFLSNIWRSVFWCDGLYAQKHLYKMGFKLNKLPGPDFLRLLIKKIDHTIIIGNMSDEERCFLLDKNLRVLCHYELPKVDFQEVQRLDILETKDVIITLPSPLQEKVAFILHDRYPDINFYCIGGALKMISNPYLEAPIVFRKYGLEWLYRFKTDPVRRFRRLLICVYKYYRNYNKIKLYRWSRF